MRRNLVGSFSIQEEEEEEEEQTTKAQRHKCSACDFVPCG
jgi:hypothetical protein